VIGHTFSSAPVTARVAVLSLGFACATALGFKVPPAPETEMTPGVVEVAEAEVGVDVVTGALGGLVVVEETGVALQTVMRCVCVRGKVRKG
jgi:hypothetical protein